MKILTHKSQQGSTLLEAIFATVIVSLVLTAMMAALTTSLFTQAQTRYRQIAGSLAQQGLEVFRRERALLGWDTFSSTFGNEVVCVNDLPANSDQFISSAGTGGCGQERFNPAGTGINFWREANVNSTANTVQVEVTVYWHSSGQTRSVTQQQIFRDIEF